ncbi:MAG TPA: hypothetical protein VLL52_09970 [Anaerolineae bacterium]|nr:hypothetical protein [Anaerolineae bacterium]
MNKIEPLIQLATLADRQEIGYLSIQFGIRDLQNNGYLAAWGVACKTPDGEQFVEVAPYLEVALTALGTALLAAGVGMPGVDEHVSLAEVEEIGAAFGEITEWILEATHELTLMCTYTPVRGIFLPAWKVSFQPTGQDEALFKERSNQLGEVLEMLLERLR